MRQQQIRIVFADIINDAFVLKLALFISKNVIETRCSDFIWAHKFTTINFQFILLACKGAGENLGTKHNGILLQFALNTVCRAFYLDFINQL